MSQIVWMFSLLPDSIFVMLTYVIVSYTHPTLPTNCAVYLLVVCVSITLKTYTIVNM